ncbi:MAG: two-component system sensor histidine kinase NtrB [Planctomycetota bacterium]|jgi:PAS domain S-box-containing protein
MEENSKSTEQLMSELSALHQRIADLEMSEKVRGRTEGELREIQKRYRVIADTAPDVIITIDNQSIIISANPAIENIFGYKADEIIGRHITELMPERPRDSHETAMRKYLETGKKSFNWRSVDLPGLHKGRHEIPLEISYGEFVMDGKHFFSGFIRDITERIQAEKDKKYKSMLERFNQELEVLVAERTTTLMAMQLADRVRTPSVVIGGLSKRLLGKENMPQKVKESLDAIREEADQLDRIVKDFEKLLENKHALFAYEDIHDIIQSTLFIIEKEAADKKIELRVGLFEKPLKITGQKELLKMMIFNMLRNAIEMTGAGGSVSISTCRDDENIILAVSDTGPGIPEEMIDKIFDITDGVAVYRFGMGLPLIKQIVSEHLGEIEVKSEAGKGTTFTVLFPANWVKRSQHLKS